MKLNKIGYLMITFLTAFTSFMFFVGGAESKDKFIISLSFTVISLLFFFIFNVKWNEEAREALLQTSDNLKIFLSHFKFAFLGQLFFVWIFLIVACAFSPLMSKLGIVLPEFIIPIIKNIAYLLMVISVITVIAYKRYGQLAFGSLIYAIVQLIEFTTRYISVKEFSEFYVVNFLIFWSIFNVFSVYAKSEAPLEKVSNKKDKKSKKNKKNKKNEVDEETELIDEENAEVFERIKKKKEMEAEAEKAKAEQTGSETPTE